jgi:hypothetical protein
MTAQHAPHTTPLWRKYLSLPHTRLGWWAVGLSALSAVLFLWLNIFAGAGPSLVGPVSDLHGWVAPWLSPVVTLVAVVLALMVLVVPLASGVVGALALGAGDRALLVWFSQVPPVLFVVLVMNAFHEPSPWALVRTAPGILIWAAVAVSLAYRRG